MRLAKPLSLVATVALLAAGCATAVEEVPEPVEETTEEAEAEFQPWEPSSPITLIVPYGAGGSTDTIGRLLADHMEGTLGVPVVVENVPGGVGAVGLQQLSVSAPDGYTISLLSGSIQTIVPHTTPLDFDPYEMTYIASTHESVAARFTTPATGFKTIDDLVAYGQEPGNELIDVTSGGFGLPDIGSVLLSEGVGGLNYRPLATDGGAESVLRLLAGDADMGQNSASTTSAYIETGELIPLLIESASWPALEAMGVPKSSDLYGYTIVNPASLVAPPGLPENIRQTLENAVRAALEDTSVFEAMALTNELIAFKTGQEAKDYARAAFEVYGPILDEYVN